ncbi:DNA-binding response regulator [Meiothermus sp. QL-1]|uniref:response regulator transcription factor n=1 Tax=Meiothermus sp. QL-1 TaxID=2058095 RepID=UPI000E0CBC8B|nr:response regulator transcription factor [Meiothermus sp. QL-1]RDI94453.1 DNA-binding response regulator [Meiothermus sp. QL-1]
MAPVRKVYSGVPTLELHGLALVSDLDGLQAHLVLDAPWGFALRESEAWPRPVLVLTGNPCPHYLRDLLEHDPDGLIATPVGPEEVREALHRVAKGHKIRYLPELEPDPLCPREREILRLVALGMTNAELENRFGLKAKTVKNYVCNILDKLGMKSRVEVALYYFGVHPMLYTWSQTGHCPE